MTERTQDTPGQSRQSKGHDRGLKHKAAAGRRIGIVALVAGALVLAGTPYSSLAFTDQEALPELAGVCAVGHGGPCNGEEEGSRQEEAGVCAKGYGGPCNGMEEDPRRPDAGVCVVGIGGPCNGGDTKTKEIEETPCVEGPCEGGPKDPDEPRVPARDGVPPGFPGYLQPPMKGESFTPAEYHVVCVPDARAGDDHFVVHALSLRIFEIVEGDPKSSAYGFDVDSCQLPWDIPWPLLVNLDEPGLPGLPEPPVAPSG